MKLRIASLVVGISILVAASACADEPATAEQVEFFETKIRPVLVRHCYECHNSADVAEGGLVLDHRAALRRGGDSGPTIDPETPETSLLLKAIRHEDDAIEMPLGSPQLAAAILADFEKWLAMGAPDPREQPPTEVELAEITAWETIREQRKQWWSFQPIRRPEIPEVADNDGSDHPVDRFVLSKLNDAGIAPSPAADRATILRRLSYVLTGLPPTAEEIDRFLEDHDPQAYERVIDRLLRSKRFGEHWARHWMDWVRYAESHGSEGDPQIPHAWQYRDYLIRALNDDVPYDQLLREHVAGDLLEQPRIDAQRGINESAIGTAHWRMVFHGFAPTDALDEKVRFTDDQINVFSKAFLGLTVSCARCHHHKFDPISQDDFYALFGILGSTRPGILDANTLEQQSKHRGRLTQLKSKIKAAVSQQWLNSLEGLDAESLGARYQDRADQADDPNHLLHPLSSLRDVPEGDSEAFQQRWRQLAARWTQQRQRLQEYQQQAPRWPWEEWFTSGSGLVDGPASTGEFTLAIDSETVLSGILPSGIYSHRLSTKHRGMLGSPRVHLDGDYDLWFRVAGDNQSLARYVVQNYPRSGTVYPVKELQRGDWQWQRYDLSYWEGDDIHLELTTAGDSPVLAKDQDRSWFGIRNAMIVKKGESPPPRDLAEQMFPLLEASPKSLDELAECYSVAIEQAILDWQEDRLSDAQALFLDACLKSKLLPNQREELSAVRPLLDEYRRLEAAIPTPTRVPGLWEADHADQPLFVRGEHTQPVEPVSRRFLEVIDAAPYQTDHSGRLQLAEDLVRHDNPLTSRVAVNRIWQYLFGEGLVRTPDNFGRMGQTPTHPELLDHLASRFRDEGWSIKQMIRYLLTSRTWQLASPGASPAGERRSESDPDNRLLAHAHVRRLPAESLRDSLLFLSGRLDLEMYGPPAGAHTDHRRRSVYTRVHRNSLNPFLEVFDAPVPFATKGRRDATNVPAQSLTLLNDPFVIECATQWARRVRLVEASDTQHVVLLFQQALGRQPTGAEVDQAREFIAALGDQYRDAQQQRERWQTEIERTEQELAAITAPVRREIESERQGSEGEIPATKPIAWWDFSQGLEDRVGNMAATVHGTARIVDGALRLDGSGYAATEPLPWTLKEKTLEAWVQLDNLDQQGGGIVSLQDRGGNVFDAIVFGERRPRHWLAGSENFRRTRDLQGVEEDLAGQQPVQVAIAWHADGTIRAYRNGRLYGTSYRSGEAITFPQTRSQLLFGLRHGAPTGNRLLQGRLFDARLYDRALSEEEVAASASRRSGIVAEQDVLAALSAEQRGQRTALQAEREALQAALRSLGKPASADQPWVDLAHAILNTKEFLYIR